MSNLRGGGGGGLGRREGRGRDEGGAGARWGRADGLAGDGQGLGVGRGNQPGRRPQARGPGSSPRVEALADAVEHREGADDKGEGRREAERLVVGGQQQVFADGGEDRLAARLGLLLGALRLVVGGVLGALGGIGIGIGIGMMMRKAAGLRQGSAGEGARGGRLTGEAAARGRPAEPPPPPPHLLLALLLLLRQAVLEGVEEELRRALDGQPVTGRHLGGCGKRGGWGGMKGGGAPRRGVHAGTGARPNPAHSR
jgi:hypothetical protein